MYLDVCPPQPANLVPVELAGNYRTCNPYARTGTPQACPDNSACLYTGVENGFICCRVQLSSSGTSVAQPVIIGGGGAMTFSSNPSGPAANPALAASERKTLSILIFFPLLHRIHFRLLWSVRLPTGAAERQPRRLCGSRNRGRLRFRQGSGIAYQLPVVDQAPQTRLLRLAVSFQDEQKYGQHSCI